FATTLWLCRVWTGAVPTLLFLWLLWRFLARWAPRAETRRLVIVAYGLGSLAMTYSVLFIAHQLSAVCIATAWIVAVWVIEDGLDLRWMVAAGAGGGGAVAGGHPGGVRGGAGPGDPVARGWRDRGRLAREVALALAGAALPIGFLLYYHWACFGSPLRTGYDASEAFHELHKQGFLGWSTFKWRAFVGSTVAPDNGL